MDVIVKLCHELAYKLLALHGLEQFLHGKHGDSDTDDVSHLTVANMR